MDFRGAFNAVTKPFRKPEGYVSAKEEQAARPPAPTPPPAQPQIGGMNTGATEKREKAAGMKDGGMVGRDGYVTYEQNASQPATRTLSPMQGQNVYVSRNSGPTDASGNSYEIENASQAGAGRGKVNPPRARGAYRDGGMVRPKMMEGGMVRGPGTATSDSIPATVRKGSYILPADTTEEVALSNGEMNLPPEAVAAVGAAVLNVVRNATHEFAAGDAAEDAAEGEPHTEGDLMAEDGEGDPRGFKDGGCVGKKRKGYAHGDPVGDEAKRIAAGLAPNLNPATSMQVRPEALRSTGIYGTPRPPAPEGSWVEAPRPAPVAATTAAVAPPAASSLPALATRTLEPSATGTVLGQASVDANAAAARGDYAQAVSQGARGIAGAIPALAVDTAEMFSPAARGVGNFVSTLFTGEPMQDTAPAAATPQPVARPVTPAVAQPATQPDSIRSRGQTIAVPPPAPQPTPAPQPQRVDGIISPRRGVYGNVTGDTAFDNRGAISPQNDAAATALDARYRQQAAGERAMAEQAAAADPRAILMGQLKSMADRNQTFSARGAQVLAGLAQTDATSRDAAGRLALEGRRVASGAEESSARTQLTQQQIAAAQRLGKLQAKLQSTTDEGERERIREQILLEQGKDKPAPQDKIAILRGGTNADGSRNADIAISTQTLRQVGLTAPVSLPPGLVVGASAKEPDGVYQAGDKKVTIKGGKVVEIK